MLEEIDGQKRHQQKRLLHKAKHCESSIGPFKVMKVICFLCFRKPWNEFWQKNRTPLKSITKVIKSRKVIFSMLGH